MATQRLTTIAPLTGVLDLRSTPDQIPQDGLRMRQNLRTVGQGKLRRGNGFEKLLNQSVYNNADFHDQLLALSGATIRQPVTLEIEVVSTRRIRSLIIGTQCTIAKLNAYSGNYQILGSGYGGTPTASAMAPRFKAAQLDDYVIFTNDLDTPRYHVLEQAADDSGAVIHEFPDLEVIGLTRAKLVWVWHNIVIFANVEMDHERAANRIVWSDFKNPTSFDPSKVESIAGTLDLYTHETILAGMPFGNSFLIYTTHGIWEMVSDPDKVFDVRRVYDGEKDEMKAVLAYPNTLVSIHDGHAYMGFEGFYYFTQYNPVPDRAEWLHRSTADIYATIDAGACDAHIAAIYGDDVFFSIARRGAENQLPDYTLRVNKTYKACDVMDVGFSALAQFSPQESPTVRDFIVVNNICTVDGLTAAGYPYGKEGLPRPLPSSGAEFTPTHFYTAITQAIPDPVTGPFAVMHVEDWNQPTSDADSLCALLDGARLDEICKTCKAVPLLVGAYSGDFCLKQLTDVFYREICDNPDAVGLTVPSGYSAAVATYHQLGITSILRFAGLNVPDGQALLEQLEVKFLAAPQIPPLGVRLRIGISAQPADSNTGEGIVWFQHSSSELRFQTNKTMAQHLETNTVPTERAHWHFYRVGRFIHVELTIEGIGGDALFSNIEGEASNFGETINY